MPDRRGENRSLCCRETEFLRRRQRGQNGFELLLNGGKAELVFADPPYNVSINGHVCGLGETQHREFAMASGEMSSQAFTDFLKSTFLCLIAHTIDGSIHYVCMDWRHIGEMMAAGDTAYSELKKFLLFGRRATPAWEAFIVASTSLSSSGNPVLLRM